MQRHRGVGGMSGVAEDVFEFDGDAVLDVAAGLVCEDTREVMNELDEDGGAVLEGAAELVLELDVELELGVNDEVLENELLITIVDETPFEEGDTTLEGMEGVWMSLCTGAAREPDMPESLCQ